MKPTIWTQRYPMRHVHRYLWHRLRLYRRYHNDYSNAYDYYTSALQDIDFVLFNTAHFNYINYYMHLLFIDVITYFDIVDISDDILVNVFNI